MRLDTVRAILALMVVGVFMFITAFMAIYPLVTPANVQLSEYSDFFSKTASVYTGIIGVIIGYYFARASSVKKNLPAREKTEEAAEEN
jgi:uncharacterized membrane protein YjfL (UPF0719 family)